MKYFIIVCLILMLLCVGILSVYFVENEKYKEVQGKTIEGLRKANEAQRDSLERELEITRDSLQIAFETIRQATKERDAAHARTQKTIRDLRKIIFVQHTDSSRTATLKQLYPSWK